MQFQAPKLISTLLLLLYLGSCSASPKGPINPKIGDKGIMIESASCDNSYYSEIEIYNAVRMGVNRIQNMVRNLESELFARYTPAGDETLPFAGPYYPQLIKLSQIETLLQPKKHYVIFTIQGRLANVVYQVESSDSRWTFEDCRLQYVDL